MTPMQYAMIKTSAGLVVEYAIIAQTKEGEGRDPSYYQSQIVEYLTKTAGALGFDITPRQTPQQAHEAMLAKRRAEDSDDMCDTERDLKRARSTEDNNVTGAVLR